LKKDAPWVAALLAEAEAKGWELRYGDVRSVFVAERSAVKV
jgi:hypothetical protein